MCRGGVLSKKGEREREFRTNEERMRKGCMQAYCVCLHECVCKCASLSFAGAYVQAHASLGVAGERSSLTQRGKEWGNEQRLGGV